MKLLLVTQDAPMYLPAFLDKFLRLARRDGHEVWGAVLFSSHHRRGLLAEAAFRLRFYGCRDFARMSGLILAGAFFSLLHSLSLVQRPHSARGVLRMYGIPEVPTGSVNSETFVHQVEEAGVDLVISIAAPEIFRTPFLRAPQRGCINYHSSLLPKYRGRQPLFWALLHGEQETGVSVHEMDQELDNGPILAQRKIRIREEDTLHTLYLRTTVLGPWILARSIRKIASGDHRRIPNEPKDARVFRFPSAEDARRFRAMGKRFFF